MKKTILLLLCLLLLLPSGCGVKSASGAKSGTLTVVTTIFPVYDWTREILYGTDHVSLELLLDSGTDLHSFQPSAGDIVSICSCDLLIYVGGESDSWVSDALKNSANPDQKVISLIELLGSAAREEEILLGMQTDETEPEEEPELDEHVWLSLKNASFFTEQIASVLSGLDPENAETYAKNAAEYTGKLNELDGQYEETVWSALHPVMLFGDRYPFAYLAADYDIGCYAAFAGCSAETEASFETVVFLAKKLDEEDLSAILKLESSDGSICEAIRAASKHRDVPILTLDSMQSAGKADIANGPSYLERMRSNLEVLKQALN